MGVYVVGTVDLIWNVMTSMGTPLLIALILPFSADVEKALLRIDKADYFTFHRAFLFLAYFYYSNSICFRVVRL